MKRIEIISASAGSGKTYRLAQTLERAISGGDVRPEAIIATTFTRDAATELASRVRRQLLDRSMVAEAQLLEASWIGTVNSVCGRIVETAAFELGLSPQLETLDESVAVATFRGVLSGLLTSERRAELDALSHRMGDFEWSQTVPRLVDYARANHLDAEALRVQGEQSMQSFSRLFEPSGSHENIVRATAGALDDFIREVPERGDATKATGTAVERAQRALRLMRGEHPVPWADWCALSKLKGGVKSKDLWEAVQDAALQHAHSPALLADAQASIRACFSLAADALEHYERHKRASAVMDFTDQEVFALEALRRDDVRARLQGTIDLVIVDEFQDTSPLQLAVFQELASLAKRSVWVGDQKQAIYGFRGTDPELMDAAIDSILDGAEPETLPLSWRSRKPLVAATSEVFAAAFEVQGLPPSRVRLDAAESRESKQLGPVMEAWCLESKNRTDDARGVADGVRQLLDDETTHVREEHQDEGELRVRRVCAGDVAVLCRTHTMCQEVADALESQGVSAAIPRAGLLSTHEARLCAAGLGLFCDPRDGLARVELVRLVWESEPTQWLEAVLAAERGQAFADHPLVMSIAALADAYPDAGAVTALDLVMDAVQAQEWCRRWGDTPRRLANLDALRAHAVVFCDTAEAAGTATSPQALVVALEALESSEHDACAVVGGSHAVVVSTWHAAKGREWPITVLTDLAERGSSTLGVRAFTPQGAFDASDPLAHRSIRYWPNPYDPRNTGMPFHEHLGEHPDTERAQQRHRSEQLRLLYVGWTRARDRVVLAGRKKVLEGQGMLELLGSAQVDLATRVFRIGELDVPLTLREVSPAEPRPADDAAPGSGPPVRDAGSHPPARVLPSELTKVGSDARLSRLGGAVDVGTIEDRAGFGSAVHAFLAADDERFDEPRRFRLAADVLVQWEVPGVRPVALLEMSDRLRGWLRQHWTVTRTYREVPLAVRRADGSVLGGIADMLVETTLGWVVIDHKTHDADASGLQAYALEVAGQLAAYAEVLAATGRPVIALLVHFPVAGQVAEVQL